MKEKSKLTFKQKQDAVEKLFRQTDTIDILKQIASKKVIMGTSASSIVLRRKIMSIDFWKERYLKCMKN